MKTNDISKEKSIWSIYLLSYRFPGSMFNYGIFLISLIALASYFGVVRPEIPDVIAMTRKLTDAGFSYVASILGFLVAGFTVFVTVTKVDIFVYMARREFEKTGESWLKYNLSAFMLAFAHYLAYLFICVLSMVFGAPKGPFSAIAGMILKNGGEVGRISLEVCLGAFFVIFGAWTIYLVLLLKSFVYNTYQVITTTVRWELERAAQSDLNHPYIQNGK